jgi:SAM-dependent methyltransferase
MIRVIRHRLDSILINLATRALLARKRRSRHEQGPRAEGWRPERDYLAAVLDRLDGCFPRECNLCGHRGYFRAHGFPPRFDARCPACGGLDRHRLIELWLRINRDRIKGKRFLHFAPEPILRRQIEPLAGTYIGADIEPVQGDRRIDITAMDLSDGSIDVIVCSHVLEHVDDRKALGEMRRVLAPQGVVLLLTPVVDAWDRTYENTDIASTEDRWLHFGQGDHVRYYGRDVVDRITSAGFAVTRFVALEPDVSKFGLVRGETIFVATHR